MIKEDAGGWTQTPLSFQEELPCLGGGDGSEGSPRGSWDGPGDPNWINHGQNQWELRITAKRSLSPGLDVRLLGGTQAGSPA